MGVKPPRKPSLQSQVMPLKISQHVGTCSSCQRPRKTLLRHRPARVCFQSMKPIDLEQQAVVPSLAVVQGVVEVQAHEAQQEDLGHRSAFRLLSTGLCSEGLAMLI